LCARGRRTKRGRKGRCFPVFSGTDRTTNEGAGYLLTLHDSANVQDYVGWIAVVVDRSRSQSRSRLHNSICFWAGAGSSFFLPTRVDGRGGRSLAPGDGSVASRPGRRAAGHAPPLAGPRSRRWCGRAICGSRRRGGRTGAWPGRHCRGRAQGSRRRCELVSRMRRERWISGGAGSPHHRRRAPRRRRSGRPRLRGCRAPAAG
jgi:hypothetical protein